MVNWNDLWEITNSKAITSGIVSGTIVNVLNRMVNNTTKKKFKVEEAYFYEKNLGDVTKLKLFGGVVKPEDRLVVGEHKQEKFIYAETGLLQFSLQKNIRKLQNVTLIYSNDDVNESVKNIEDFCNSLVSEKLHQKSRSGKPMFRSKCDLYYTSKDQLRIKNFLICINGGKKGYDQFVLQTLQSPLGKYTSSFTIDDDRNLTKFEIVAPITVTKKRDFGITSRIVKLDDLDSMMVPFHVNNREVMPGEETEAFKLFIDSFRSAYELNGINIEVND